MTEIDQMDRAIIGNRDGYHDEDAAEDKLQEAIAEGDEDAMDFANLRPFGGPGR